jgi:hypothetical protein
MILFNIILFYKIHVSNYPHYTTKFFRQRKRGADLYVTSRPFLPGGDFFSAA